MAAVCFSKLEVAISKLWIEIYHRNVVCRDLDILKQAPSQYTNLKVDLFYDAMAASLKNRYDIITPPGLIRSVRYLVG